MIVPCGVTASLKPADREKLYSACDEYKARLLKAGVRVKADMRENYSPGWKFNHWEQKGVPIRLEVGPRDLKESQYVVVRRDTGEKIVMRQCGLEDDVPALLETIQSAMFARAREELATHLRQAFQSLLASIHKQLPCLNIIGNTIGRVLSNNGRFCNEAY